MIVFSENIVTVIFSLSPSSRSLASKIVQLSAAPSHSCRSSAWYSLVRGSGVYSSFCGRFISLPYLSSSISSPLGISGTLLTRGGNKKKKKKKPVMLLCTECFYGAIPMGGHMAFNTLLSLFTLAITIA